MFRQALPHEFQRVAADFSHHVSAFQPVTFGSVDGQLDIGLSYVFDGEVVSDSGKKTKRAAGTIGRQAELSGVIEALIVERQTVVVEDRSGRHG